MASFLDDGMPTLVARGVSKSFRVPVQQVQTLKERALHPLRRIGHHEYRALNDVSFAIERGEFFGIAGRNGSGKSTLLKCLAGIYSCDGQIWRRGRLSTFIELGVGFNPELAARDNVITNAIMMGLTPRQARERYEKVIEFAELAEFEDLKLKNYSSGMQVRLAFSVAVQVDADILLVDEILAVGDAAFQQKCFDVFTRLREEGKTLVLVTHTMSELTRFCDRALLLERGAPVLLANASEVADRYLEVNFEHQAPAQETVDRPRREDDAQVLEVWLETAEGKRQLAAAQRQRLTLRVLVSFAIDVEDPQASVYVLDDEKRSIVVGTTALSRDHSGQFGAGEQVVFSFSFENVLAPGRYSAVVDIFRRGEGLHRIGRFESKSFSFLVTGAHPLGGAVDVPVDVAIERLNQLDTRRISA
jgi:ABC-type polysaccharide/polyol phosphate transport system ATPase subunit